MRPQFLFLPSSEEEVYNVWRINSEYFHDFVNNWHASDCLHRQYDISRLSESGYRMGQDIRRTASPLRFTCAEISQRIPFHHQMLLSLHWTTRIALPEPAVHKE